MSRVSRFLLACVAALGLAIAAAPDGRAQGTQFALRICNHSAVNAGVAFAYRIDPDPWFVAGWLVVDSGSCRDVGTMRKGNFYIYAEGASGQERRVTWPGQDVQLCVEYPGPFHRENSEGFTCDSDLLKGFTRFFAEENTGTYTVNLR